jgi:hypothetical protein
MLRSQQSDGGRHLRCGAARVCMSYDPKIVDWLSAMISRGCGGHTDLPSPRTSRAVLRGVCSPSARCVRSSAERKPDRMRSPRWLPNRRVLQRALSRFRGPSRLCRCPCLQHSTRTVRWNSSVVHQRCCCWLHMLSLRLQRLSPISNKSALKPPTRPNHSPPGELVPHETSQREARRLRRCQRKSRKVLGITNHALARAQQFSSGEISFAV